MDRMIYTALNALSNQRDQRVTQAQNLANQNVPGYRRDLNNEGKAFFANAMNTAMVRAYQTETGPAGFSPDSGPLQQTGNTLDMAVVGEGYFYVQPDGVGDPALSRRGDMHRNADGTLVNGAGDILLDTAMLPVKLPLYKELQITDIGEVWVQPVDAEAGEEPLLLATLATVVPDEGLQLLKSEDAQIRAVDGTVPAPNQLAKLSQGVLEGSNVNTVEELVNSIEMQRSFELGIRMVSTASELDEAGARLLRSPE
ncbi:Putative proximal rod protein [Thalassovita gelatinovora]|uniref:Flagellar basal-body rod protein FlgF n=1 Tax=Thalassovita gelatinovora TaxID=53501 RepID=A0A0P1FKX7_THAGE|nr:flagellar hook-basal body complex protein [Thalassovita gelatinovora]QIZ78994.1 flagellar hook-basal body complex protein [Thalassovita gelatinovora]CUH68535.1 Putative proximal rod protein [Thalassovita gelatinovora]SEQ54213.1 flagellar basal-body rod protein FlgF [Thalassovita gelatinovora]